MVMLTGGYNEVATSYSIMYLIPDSTHLEIYARSSTSFVVGAVLYGSIWICQLA